jgi:hypothetical protein
MIEVPIMKSFLLFVGSKIILSTLLSSALNLCEIWSSRSGGYEDYRLLECDAM